MMGRIPFLHNSVTIKRRILPQFYLHLKKFKHHFRNVTLAFTIRYQVLAPPV